MKFYDVLHNIFNFFVGFQCTMFTFDNGFAVSHYFLTCSKNLLKISAEFF